MRKYPMAKYRMKKMRGGSKFGQKLKRWMGDVNNWLKQHKVLSILGKAAKNKYAPNNPIADLALDIGKQSGYGKKRMVRMRRRRMRQRGSSLAPVGGAITNLAIRR